MTEFQARLVHGDFAAKFRFPVPFRDQSGRQIGEVVAVWYDGEYTVGTVRLFEDMPLPKSLQLDDRRDAP